MSSEREIRRRKNRSRTYSDDDAEQKTTTSSLIEDQSTSGEEVAVEGTETEIEGQLVDQDDSSQEERSTTPDTDIPKLSSKLEQKRDVTRKKYDDSDHETRSRHDWCDEYGPRQKDSIETQDPDANTIEGDTVDEADILDKMFEDVDDKPSIISMLMDSAAAPFKPSKFKAAITELRKNIGFDFEDENSHIVDVEKEIRDTGLGVALIFLVAVYLPLFLIIMALVIYMMWRGLMSGVVALILIISVALLLILMFFFFASYMSSYLTERFKKINHKANDLLENMTEKFPDAAYGAVEHYVS